MSGMVRTGSMGIRSAFRMSDMRSRLMMIGVYANVSTVTWRLVLVAGCRSVCARMIVVMVLSSVG